MIRLKKETETYQAFQNLQTEETLLRWLNYHLRNAGSDRIAKNFSGDLKV
jgi:plastin-1